MITQHQSAHTVVAVVRGTEVMARIKKVLESSAMLLGAWYPGQALSYLVLLLFFPRELAILDGKVLSNLKVIQAAQPR